MSKNFRIIYLLVFLGALFGLNYLLFGSLSLQTGDISIWLHTGLLMLILGSFWIEPYFTKPADVVINGLIVFISISTLNDPPLSEWWDYLRYASIILSFFAFFIIWSGSPALIQHDTSRLKRFVYMLVTRIGNARIVFSCVFLLALLSYFDLKSENTKWMLLFWGIVLSFKYLEIDTLLDSIFKMKKSISNEVIGIVSRLVTPNMFRFILFEKIKCKKGSFVALSKKGDIEVGCPLGIVLCHRKSPQTTEVEAMLINKEIDDIDINKAKVVIKADLDNEDIEKQLSECDNYQKLNRLVAFASRGSDISTLYFELVRKPKIAEGHLVSVDTEGNPEVLFQVINGKLAEEESIDSSERVYILGDAHQLGTWSKERQGFETFNWVVPENAPVFHVSPETIIEKILKENIIQTGYIPNSSYPVNINIKECVLYHSALLGVTGSGKSFLAYQLIEEAANNDIKVICLDGTGDHKKYVRDPILLNRNGAVEDFLNSSNYKIGIAEFIDKSIHPIKAAHKIAKICLEWCEKNRKDEEIKEPIPKVLLVFEEAHQLVPEWNSNPERTLQDVVNQTSQIALQARKYGLGFMIITQRTANVTKSILNQCNTLFAFQAYDETGFDFMKNYMGLHYVQALPNLKKRQGILVGKASLSDRPVIVRFFDQDRKASGRDITIIPTPEEAQATVANDNKK